jgi:hypothetical protein
VAAWVHDNVADDASVAASEIGVLGWYGQAEMIDYLGLLDPASADDLASADMLGWLERNQPDYWLVHDDETQPGLQPWPMEAQGATAPWFDDVFRPVLSEPGLVLYRRVAPVPVRDGADPPA